MPLIPVTTFDDPRLADYRNLKDRELAKLGGKFIAEGEHVVRRLLDSPVATDSVLLSTRQVESVAPAVPAHVPTYVAADDVIHRVLGYKFHSGVMAVGVRPPPRTLDDVLPRDNDRLTVVACPELANGENLGSMVRLCAGFGVDALLIGERSADPFIRQSVRVSMGTIFRLPLVRSADFSADLARLRDAWNAELIATVVDAPAEPLAAATRRPRAAILFGNEAQGLSPQVVAACDRRVTIPMHYGTDSLNVAVAAGIFLYHFTARERA